MTTLATLIRTKPALRFPAIALLLAALVAVFLAAPYLVRWLVGHLVAGIDVGLGQLIAAAPIEIFFVLIYVPAVVVAVVKASPEVRHDLG